MITTRRALLTGLVVLPTLTALPAFAQSAESHDAALDAVFAGNPAPAMGAMILTTGDHRNPAAGRLHSGSEVTTGSTCFRSTVRGSGATTARSAWRSPAAAPSVACTSWAPCAPWTKHWTGWT